MRITLLICLFLSFTAHAETATSITSGDTFTLNDGRAVRLNGIRAEGKFAEQTLTALTAGKNLTLQDTETDRYGRISASILVNGKSVQMAMVSAGAATAYPVTGAEPHIAELIRAEQSARKNKSGMWADAAHADLSPETAEDQSGSYAIVSGRVVNAARVKNKLYLNFGPDWRTDFTVTIVARDLRLFKKADIDLLGLAGKSVRVRGLIEQQGGPMITIASPLQLEILN